MNFLTLEKSYPIRAKTGSPQVDFSVELKPYEIRSNWKRCSLMANFMSEYLSTANPNNFNLKVSLSTIINELIENAVKFSASDEDVITLSFQVGKDEMRIKSKNTADKTKAVAFEEFVKRIETSDIDTMFLEQIEYNAEHAESSQLGLIMIVKDYNANIKVNISQLQNDIYQVDEEVTINPESFNYEH